MAEIDKEVDSFLAELLGNAPTRPINLSQSWCVENVAKTSIPCDLVILTHDSQVAVAERKKGRVVIYGAEGKELRVLDQEDIAGMKEPLSLCMWEHRMMLADCRHIHLINTSSWLEDRVWTPRRGGTGEILAVHGMATSPVSKELILSEVSCKPSVSVWDLESERYKYTLKPPKTAPFRKPQHVAAAPDGTVYVSDCEAHCVYVFDKKGKFVNLIGQKGPEEQTLIYPMGIDVAGNSGDILVADPPNGRINLYTAKGEFRYPMLNHLDGLKQPLAVRYYNNNIAVTEEILEHGKDQNIVRLFQIKRGK